jgi:hypothetical protein
MPLSTTVTKVLEVYIASELSRQKLSEKLVSGDLAGFESCALTIANQVYDKIVGLYIQNVSISEEFVNNYETMHDKRAYISYQVVGQRFK